MFFENYMKEEYNQKRYTGYKSTSYTVLFRGYVNTNADREL